MNRKLSPLCVIALFAISNLMAQANNTNTLTPANTFNPATVLHLQPAPAVEANHVGDGPGRFPIGSAENPVTAREFCAFLNSDTLVTIKNPLAPYLPPQEKPINSSGYDDDALMNTSSPQYCISYNGAFAGDMLNLGSDPQSLYYSLVPGTGDFIIDAIVSLDVISSQSEISAQAVAESFESWRSTNEPTQNQ